MGTMQFYGSFYTDHPSVTTKALVPETLCAGPLLDCTRGGRTRLTFANDCELLMKFFYTFLIL